MKIIEPTYWLFINPDFGRVFEKPGMTIIEILEECKKHSLLFNLSPVSISNLLEWAKMSLYGEKWLSWCEGLPEVTIAREYQTLNNLLNR